MRQNPNDGSLMPLDAAEPYDVCIVGSGPAGTVLGSTLAGQGARVLMLESGRDLAAWLANARIRSLARYEASGDTDYPLSRTTSSGRALARVPVISRSDTEDCPIS